MSRALILAAALATFVGPALAVEVPQPTPLQAPEPETIGYAALVAGLAAAAWLRRRKR